MNRSRRLRAMSRFLHALFLRWRTHLPRQHCLTFTPQSDPTHSGIGPIFVINLDRQPSRWLDMQRELGCIVDAAGKSLSERVVRHPACDAQCVSPGVLAGAEIDPFYTLTDQLFVEPQPQAVPDSFDLARPIRMTQAEIAVAQSHIDVWKAIAQSGASYSLVLEDDVWFERGFGRILEQAWREMEGDDRATPGFDVLYVSYKEVRHGAPKELLSKNVFRPERGLWYLSGYVLSRKGAQALLGLLPCRGPIDLWINHKFREIDVRALRRSMINQRLDVPSTNSYSVLPALTRIGVLDDCDAALFHQRPIHGPVFAFGAPGAGLSSLAMALSMLGYRRCSDLEQIPEEEFERLLAGDASRVFNAYVNIASLRTRIGVLIQRYPHAKFIVVVDTEARVDRSSDNVLTVLNGADVVRLPNKGQHAWRTLCEHLRLAPPCAPYPTVPDIGVRRPCEVPLDNATRPRATRLRYDPSPWVVDRRAGWAGIGVETLEPPDSGPSVLSRVSFEDDLTDVRPARWLLRNDTFPGNLGLFRPGNVSPVPGGGLSLEVSEEPLGVRNFSAAAISSRANFLFGRFEAVLRPTNVSGLVTGFFLHRDSPRQEIDVEIAGNHPDRLLVNVFYNPGTEGARFDYGYRGTPTTVSLGLDTSKALHRFAIEWEPCEIRWFVDDQLVHRRLLWDPTPIPHLPMTLHVNTWPTRSRELAGRLLPRALPAVTTVRRIAVQAFNAEAPP